MRKHVLIFLFLSLSIRSYSQKRYTRDDYIKTYSKIAVDEMKRSGIPASITLAQGMLESDNGNSSLTREANNHFGIKCHKHWDGKRVYHDDDANNECFRKYPSAEDSYRDHTDFLMQTSRYIALFELKSNDYKGWAKGLKKSGYATSSSYSSDLIRIIEENELYRLDEGDFSRPFLTKIAKNKQSSWGDEDFTIDIKRRKIYERNRIKYIIVENGDNIEKITKELDLLSWEIRKYNELTDSAKIVPSQVLYTQPKRWRAEVGNDFHTVKEGETMYSISQLYGMKLSKLYRKNRMEPGTQPTISQKLWLRKRKPKESL